MIDLLFEKGRQFSVYPLKIFWIAKNDQSTLQAAVGVSSRNFKKATDRNRVKRILRESYRLQKATLKQILERDEKQLSVFILYNGKELPKFENLFEKMELVINRLKKYITEETVEKNQ